MDIYSLLAISLLIEGLITYGQTIIKQKKIQWQIVVAICVAFIFCYNSNINLFPMLGFTEKYPIIGIITTAIMLSRGSNYMFEFYHQLNSWRNSGLQ